MSPRRPLPPAPLCRAARAPGALDACAHHPQPLAAVPATALLGALLAAVGCGGDVGVTELPDTTADASGLADVSGDDDIAIDDPSHPFAAFPRRNAPAVCAVVATSDFRASGSITVIDGLTFHTLRDVTSTHVDALVHTQGADVYIVNRQGGDSIQRLAGDDRFRTRWQRSVGPGANPWGIAVDGDRGWVTRYADASLQAVALDAVDGLVLDGAPRSLGDRDADKPLHVFVRGDRVYVVTQGLDAYPQCTAGSRGALHVFDATTLEPVQRPLALAACNPTSWAWIDDDTLLLGHTGNHRVAGGATDDGGIEIIDVASMTSRGLVATEAMFGGRDVVHVAYGHGALWVALADGAFSATVHRATLDPWALSEPHWRTDTGGVFDLEVAEERLWIADRSLRAPGVVVLDVTSGAHVAGPIDTGFAPFDIGFVHVLSGRCGG